MIGRTKEQEFEIVQFSSLPSAHTLPALEQIMEWRANPTVIHCDHSLAYIGGLIQA